jgi:hypothetical protein
MGGGVTWEYGVASGGTTSLCPDAAHNERARRLQPKPDTGCAELTLVYSAFMESDAVLACRSASAWALRCSSQTA